MEIVGLVASKLQLRTYRMVSMFVLSQRNGPLILPICIYSFGFINLYSPCALFVGHGMCLVPSNGIDSPDVEWNYVVCRALDDSELSLTGQARLDLMASLTKPAPPESKKCFLLCA
ncbi:Protein of unknown function [Pyronema omphalodes CBS 100304]|uniref:Uncharacterized protein n=1 Tax=Pyronema omphalodes (strain CBS 100304) TaxID=1076935 RepID=U4LRC9_PYROM|nr:Protein of unknown function [Pyronema omphalodes CBS 100304]